MTLHDNYIFVCDCEEELRSACRREIFYKEHDGKRYCVLHYPGKEKIIDFQKALLRKVFEEKDFDFSGVWFPNEVNFQGFTFNGLICRHAHFLEDADFSYATILGTTNFSHAQFSGDVEFHSTKFMGVTYLSEAQFKAGANFHNAEFFGRVYFSESQFASDTSFFDVKFDSVSYFNNTKFNANVDFTFAHFKKSTKFGDAVFNADTYFKSAKFVGMDEFKRAVYEGFEPDIPKDMIEMENEKFEVSYAGAKFRAGLVFEENVFTDEIILSFAAATFDRPERVIFHSVSMRPHWFVNVDPRKFNFINVEWGRLNSIILEFLALMSTDVRHKWRMLEIACRQLAVNAEENNRYEEAARFRYLSMEAKREGRRRRFDFLNLSWWYWILSGYGERVLRAFIMLVIIWLLFAVGYTNVGFTRWEPKITNEADVLATQRDEVGAPLRLKRAVTYSLEVMTLQKPEPRPATPWARALVLVETILGPLQAALLALAIRRKFMR